jgi:peroxiredoxin Q/BCP
VRDEIETFRKHNIQPFGVNPAGVESHQKYVAKFKFPFPLLSDADKTIATAYGALKPMGLGIQRSVVLVDQDGKVVFAVRGAPSPAEVVAALGAA